jgi:hypothetical protein
MTGCLQHFTASLSQHAPLPGWFSSNNSIWAHLHTARQRVAVLVRSSSSGVGAQAGSVNIISRCCIAHACWLLPAPEDGALAALGLCTQLMLAVLHDLAEHAGCIVCTLCRVSMLHVEESPAALLLQLHMCMAEACGVCAAAQ